MNQWKGAVRFTAISFVILLISSIFIWGFQSDWGKVRIERLSLVGPDGSDISTIAYIPENATDETPAPSVIIMHGRSNQGHSNDTWSMELARRGYVVFSPDLQGGGESTPTVDRATQAVSLTEYVNSLSFVQKDAVNLVGYSFGTDTCLRVYEAMPDIINSITEVFGPYRLKNYGGVDNIDTNLGLLKAECDQYDYYFIGSPEECEAVVTDLFDLDSPVVPYQDYDWKGNLFRYMPCEGTLHQTGNISSSTLTNIISFVTTVAEAPISLELNDQVWLPHQIFSGIACVTMMFFFASIINLLLQLPMFSCAINKPKLAAPRKGAAAWAKDILFTTLIPAIIFIPVSAMCMRYTAAPSAISKVFTSVNLNGIMGWLLVVAVIGVIRMVIQAQKKKRAGVELTMADYALGSQEEKRLNWKRPAMGLLLGAVSVTFALLWVNAVEDFAGINYQVWNLSTYLRVSPERLVRAIPYILVIFTVMLIGNMGQRVLPSTGNEKKDIRIAVAVNTVLTASALFLLLVIQYGGNFIIGTGNAVLPQLDIYNNGGVPSAGALDFSFGYCYMMGGTTGVVTYIYRKYGNIWLGVIPAAIFAGIVTLSSFTLVA